MSYTDSTYMKYTEGGSYNGPEDLDEGKYLRDLYHIDRSVQGSVSALHEGDLILTTLQTLDGDEPAQFAKLHKENLADGGRGANPAEVLKYVQQYENDTDDNGEPPTSEDVGEEDESLLTEVKESLEDVARGDDPDPEELTSRELFIATKLQQGTTIEGLVDELDTRPAVLTEHLSQLKRQGWSIYFDESADMVAIEGDNVLRSSEHKGTRTRKANRYWEMRHNELVREFRGLELPDTGFSAEPGNEDWVTHLTDLHAGDLVRTEDGTVIYQTEDIPDVIRYITDQSLSLAKRHNADYDDAHLLWGGDMVTGEAIYEGQFEDLDAWIDEQIDILVEPLVQQIKAFAQSDMFDTVQVVSVVGNHGQNRASGTSRQANMDLILYKLVRNVVAQINEHGDGLLDNVEFKIGQAEAFRNFPMRDGRVKGHLRHGQHRKPQADTSARKKEWQATYIDHDFDIAYMGHYHVPGIIPWNGPPIIATGSPKPAGEFVRRIGARDPQGDYENVATVHGVSDEGLTSVYPVDTRNYDQ